MRVNLHTACAMMMLLPWCACAEWPIIAPFPGAEQTETRTDESSRPRMLVLGSLEKINRVLKPESERHVTGSFRAETYYLPDAENVESVRDHFDTELARLGETLFECIGRSCGSSIYWANAILNQPVLYGPEQFQSYRIVRVSGEGERYVAAYVAQRGNRKVYAHLTLVTAEGKAADGGFAKLMASGSVVYDDSLRQRQALKTYLESHPSSTVAVVVHGGQGLGVDAALDETRRRAERLRRRLIGEGIAGDRVLAHGVGQLAPADGKPPGRTELVPIN